MKITLKILSISFLVLVVSNLYAQVKRNENLVPHNIGIGEKVPNLLFSKIVNDRYKNIPLKDIKAPLIILDFWNLNCSSCIDALPELGQIQKEFGSQLKILGVAPDNAIKVADFIKNNKKGKKANLPSVTEDKTLDKWFRHWAISHEVWIYNGVVVALTGPHDVISENVKLILSGKQNHWPVKDDYTAFNLNTQSLVPGGSINNVKFYSIVTPVITNKHAVMGEFNHPVIRDSANHTVRFLLFNKEILKSYKIIWSDLGKPIDNVQLNVKDLNLKYGFCYETLLPDYGQADTTIYHTVLKDLDKMFGLKTEWKVVKTKCRVLYRADTTNNLMKTKGGDPNDNSTVGNLHKFRNVSINQILPFLNHDGAATKTIDETGYGYYRVDLDLDINPTIDLLNINQQLAKYGLGLKEEQRDLDTFILTELPIRK
jgi:thiol-disulfide isomerase/thioredoxin